METKEEAAASGVVDRGGKKWLKSGCFFKTELKGLALLDVGYEKKIKLCFTDMSNISGG